MRSWCGPERSDNTAASIVLAARRGAGPQALPERSLPAGRDAPFHFRERLGAKPRARSRPVRGNSFQVIMYVVLCGTMRAERSTPSRAPKVATFRIGSPPCDGVSLSPSPGFAILAANPVGCDRISLRRTSLRRKIAPRRPAIRGMSVQVGQFTCPRIAFRAGETQR